MTPEDFLLAGLAIRYKWVTHAQAVEAMLQASEEGLTLEAGLSGSGVLTLEQLEPVHHALALIREQEFDPEELPEAAERPAFDEEEAELPPIGARKRAEEAAAEAAAAPPPTPKPTAPAKSMTMFCPLCDMDVAIRKYEMGKTYRCGCGAVLLGDEEEESDSLTELTLEDSGTDFQIMQEDAPDLKSMVLGADKKVELEDPFEKEEGPSFMELEAERRAEEERKSAEASQKAREMSLRFPAVMRQAGEHEQKGEYGLVIEATNEVIDALPARPEPYLLRARALMEVGRLPDARKDMDVLIDRGQRLGAASQLRGFILFQCGDFAKALSDLRIAVDQGLDDLETRIIRGLCHHKQRKLTQARQDFVEALQMEEKHKGPIDARIKRYLKVAKDFVESGTFDQSVLDLGTKVDAPATESEIERARAAREYTQRGDHYNAGREYLIAGKLDEAQAAFEALLGEEEVGDRLTDQAGKAGFEPWIYRDLVAHENLAKIAESRNDFTAVAQHRDEAAKVVAHARAELERGADHALQAASCWEQLGDADKARASFSLGADLMGWPDLQIGLTIDEEARENQKLTAHVTVTNVGRAKAEFVHLRIGSPFKALKNLSLSAVPAGETRRVEWPLKAVKRGRGTRCELKLSFKVPERDTALMRVLGFDADVHAGYSARKEGEIQLLGLPEPAAPASAPASSPALQPVSAVPAAADVCSCGTQINPAWKMCPMCGASTEKPTCNSCGQDVQAGWKLCPFCGAEQG